MTNAIGSKSSCVLLARVLVERDPEFRVVRGFGLGETWIGTGIFFKFKLPNGCQCRVLHASEPR